MKNRKKVAKKLLRVRSKIMGSNAHIRARGKIFFFLQNKNTQKEEWNQAEAFASVFLFL